QYFAGRDAAPLAAELPVAGTRGGGNQPVTVADRRAGLSHRVAAGSRLRPPFGPRSFRRFTDALRADRGNLSLFYPVLPVGVQLLSGARAHRDDVARRSRPAGAARPGDRRVPAAGGERPHAVGRDPRSHQLAGPFRDGPAGGSGARWFRTIVPGVSDAAG